jgi:hypothetical protein
VPKEVAGRGGQTALVPEFAEDQAIHEESTALKSARPSAECVGHCLHLVKQRSPVLRHSLRRAKQVIAEDRDRQRVVVDNETSVLDPLWRVGGSRQVQNLGFVEVDLAVRCPTVLGEHSLKFGNVSSCQTQGQVIGKGGNNETTPSKRHSLKAETKRREQRLQGEVEQKRGKGVALADPTRNGNSGKGLAVLKNERMTRARRVKEHPCKSGRKTELLQYSEEIIVRHPVVGLLLI